jgi:sugar lactone lactonase YvrE
MSVGSGFNAPNGVAVDSVGNVFVADTGSGVVKEILAPDYTTTLRIAAAQGNFNQPNAIAIDTAGNLFVADENNGTIKKIAAAGGYVTVSTIASGFAFPTGVAVDREGNVFVADFFANQLTELLAAISYSVRITIPGSFSDLAGVAVDADGNLFTADEYDGIQEITAASGYQQLVNLASGNQNIVQPFGIGLDSNGNIYYTDLALGAVFEIFKSSGYQTVVPVLSGLNEPEGVTVDANGNVFIADPNNGNGVIDKFSVGSSVANFGSVPLATSTPPTQTLTFEFDSPGKIQAPLALTQGASGQDFKVTGGSCAAASYFAGDTCTVTVSFTPNFAGLRLGALELVNRSGAPIVTVYLSGTGTGPQLAFLPGTQSTLGSGFSAPQGVAADGAGNVFVADSANNAVKEIFASGGYTAVRLLGSDFNAPQGLAVDGAGNIFVADTGNNAVEELSAVDGYSLVTSLGSGFSAPTAVSVDGSGNIIVADTGDNSVQEILAAGGYSTVNTLPPNSTVPFNTQANVNGSLYIADAANNRVLKQDQTTPPSLNFVGTAVGSDSAPQTVTVVNIGNMPLVFSNLSYPADFSANGSIGNQCTSSTSLGANATCVLPIQFSPQTKGLKQEYVNLTDNTLGVSGSVQAIAVSGTATQGSQSIVFTDSLPSTAVASPGLTYTLSASGGGSGNPVTFSILSGPGSLSGTYNNILSFTGWGVVTVAANQAGDANYNAASQVTQNITITALTPTVTVTPAAFSISTTENLSVLVTVNGGADNPPPSGTVKLSGGGYTSAAIPLTSGSAAIRIPAGALADGNDPITAIYTPDSASYFYGAAQGTSSPVTVLGVALLSPTPGSTLTTSSVTFTWSQGTGVTQYSLAVSDLYKGSSNLYSQSGIRKITSATVANLPVNGENIYVRLCSFSSSWQCTDSTYTMSGTPLLAALTSPAPGSTLSASSATFRWSAGAGVTNYILQLGSTGPGSKDLYNGASTTGTSASVTGLPTNGLPIYARLYSQFNGSWARYVDYTLNPPTPAALTSPSGATITAAGQSFTWTPVAGATGYTLFLGTMGVGSGNLLDAHTTASTVSSGKLPAGTIYVRLWTNFNGVWMYRDSTFTAQ